MPNLIERDARLCTGCGLCVTACPQLVYAQHEQRAVPQLAAPERCFGCLACEEECRAGALRIYRLPAGVGREAVPAPGEGLAADTTYDLLVVGAGPAGLGAAIRGRMLGLRVGVLERLPSPRRSHHPDGGLLFSARDVYTMRRAGGGLRLEEIDVEIPADVVREWLQDFALVGPSGQRTAPYTDDWEGFPLVSKDGLVACLVERARALGATIAFNTRAAAIGELAADGAREVLIDGGVTLRGRVVVSAEGSTGRLVHRAGVPVNARRLAWAFAAYAGLPPSARPTATASFLVSEGPGAGAGGVLPYLGYVSSGPAALHLAYGPIQRRRTRAFERPLTEILLEMARVDPRVPVMAGGEVADPGAAELDGCRVYVRYLPQRMVADALIAAGDAITTCGMMTNIMALKTGDLAAQVARDAIARGDTTAAGLADYARRVGRLQMFKGMSWMNNLLIRAPLELDRAGQDRLYDKLRSLCLARVQRGQVAPIVLFYLRMIPTLVASGELRSYLLP